MDSYEDFIKFLAEYGSQVEPMPFQEALIEFLEKYDPPYRLVHGRKGCYLTGVPKES